MFPLILIPLLVITVSGTPTQGGVDDFPLSVPVRLEANGIPIDVTVGHAAPYIIDFDGDGLDDLVGRAFQDVSNEFCNRKQRAQRDGRCQATDTGRMEPLLGG